MIGPKKAFLFKLTSVCIGLFLSLLLLELSLRVGNKIIIKKTKNNSQALGRLIIFSGDSWTYGYEADSGKGFFDLLKADDDFKQISFVNLGYGGNNSLQVVNAVVNYGRIPDIVIVNMGINDWRLMEFEEFISTAEDYFSAKENVQLRQDFKFYNQWSWFRHLRIYKLYCYLLGVKQNKINMKFFYDRLGSKLFWDLDKKFSEEYPDDFNERLKALPKALKEAEGLSLDQKFFFTNVIAGFYTRESEEILRKADLFYPEKLSVISYDIYRKIGVQEKQLGDTRILFLKWAFKLLKKWSIKNNVTVFVQTYPEISNESLGNNVYTSINKLIKAFAGENGFKVIDHNANGVDWVKYRTPWHVKNEGHRLMKDIIKFHLLRDKRLIKYEKEGSYN